MTTSSTASVGEPKEEEPKKEKEDIFSKRGPVGERHFRVNDTFLLSNELSDATYRIAEYNIGKENHNCIVVYMDLVSKHRPFRCIRVAKFYGDDARDKTETLIPQVMQEVEEFIKLHPISKE